MPDPDRSGERRSGRGETSTKEECSLSVGHCLLHIEPDAVDPLHHVGLPSDPSFHRVVVEPSYSWPLSRCDCGVHGCHANRNSHRQARFVGTHLACSQLLDGFADPTRRLLVPVFGGQAFTHLGRLRRPLDHRRYHPWKLLPGLLTRCCVPLHKNYWDVPVAGEARLNPDFSHTLTVDPPLNPSKSFHRRVEVWGRKAIFVPSLA